LKLAEQDLSLDLQADDEEEHSHQGVVDPVQKGHVESPVTEDEARIGMPYFFVGFPKRSICHDEGQSCGAHHHDATRGLSPEKPYDGSRH
jgi:hypothetical protein